MNKEKSTLKTESPALSKGAVMLSFGSVGDKVIVVEKTYTGEMFEWDGIITQVTEAYIETKHARNAVTHPQWHNFMRAYSDTWTKHYCFGNLRRVEPNGA